MLAQTLAAAGIPAQILGDGPIAQLAFSPSPVTDHDSYLATDRVLGRKVMLELVRNGVFLNPMGTKLYLSLMHGTQELERFCEALTRSLRALQN